MGPSEKDHRLKELARRLCAAYGSCQTGVSIATAYKNLGDDVGVYWYGVAALVNEEMSKRMEVLAYDVVAPESDSVH
jgi:hypothetical protein